MRIIQQTTLNYIFTKFKGNLVLDLRAITTIHFYNENNSYNKIISTK